METDWCGHTLEVRGDWTYRWLYLAPEYELLVDGDRVDRTGGPVLRPRLEAKIEDDDGEMHHVEIDLLSIAGFRPYGQLSVDGEQLDSARVPVRNILNPFLVLIIIASTIIMLYLGPGVLREYFPGSP
jgi:hypothetical protein